MKATRTVALASLSATLVAATTIAGAAGLSTPTAITGPVSALGATTTTVTATVNPSGESTTWYIEYGTSTSYGKKTTSQSTGSGTANVSVSVELTGLSSGTTYHYRAVATNASGTSKGADGIFTTRSAPSAATGAATAIGPFRATLNGSLNPNGVATTWFFEYGTSTSYGSKTSAQSAGSGTATQNVAADIGGLSAGHTYHFRLVATSEAGTTKGSDQTFTTDSAPVVKTGSASSITATSALVAGTVNPKGRGTTAWFEYGTSTSYGSRTSTQDLGSATSDRTVTATLAGLAPGTTYHFRVVAQSDAGTVPGADASFKTTSAPAVTTGPAASVAAASATLTGSVNPNGRSTRWYFEYGTSTSYGSRTPQRSIGSGTGTVGVSAEVSGLQPAATYHYRLVASSSAGTSASADATLQTLGPPVVATGPVTRLSSATAVVSGRVNPADQQTSYWVDYGRTPAYGFRTASTAIGAGTADVGVSVPLGGLIPGLRYHYRLVAANAAGTSVGGDASFGAVPLPRDAEGRVVGCTIVGTVGPDVLRGTPGRDVICSLGGSDVISGGGGDDVIYAGPGDDRADGGGGSDTIFGGSGDDELAGGPGNDRLDGGPGRDVLLAGPGRDDLLARDGRRDVVNGGPGRDRARVDRRLDRRVSIERLLG